MSERHAMRQSPQTQCTADKRITHPFHLHGICSEDWSAVSCLYAFLHRLSVYKRYYAWSCSCSTTSAFGKGSMCWRFGNHFDRI